MSPSHGHDHLTAKLNPAQHEAVTHHGTPLLIVAGAGSGKTRVITHRIAWLVREVGIPESQILAVTFTNKAAREMRERVGHLLGRGDDPHLAIGTFHARCATILRREADAAGLDKNFTILDERDQAAAARKVLDAMGLDEKKVRPGQALHMITLAKMRLMTPEQCRDDEEFSAARVPYAEIYAEYDKLLRRDKALDFEDLIFRTVLLLRDTPAVKQRLNARYRYLLVDEFQDTNHSQFELVKLLAGPDRNVSVVGDEDQAIYSWRGADVRNLLDFQQVYPDAKIVRLEQNYRSVANVLKAAGSVIANNTQRLGKTLWTELEAGEKLRALMGRDENEEGEKVATAIATLMHRHGVMPNEIAIFYRSHALSRALEDGLRRLRVPYRILGGQQFYDRAEVKDVLCYLRLAMNPDADLAFERVVNVPTRGIGQKSVGDLAVEAIKRNLSLFRTAQALVAGGTLKGKARTGLEAFTAMVTKWHDLAATTPVGKLLDIVLADTRYREEGVGDIQSIDGASRLENIKELESVVSEFALQTPDATVATFLESMSLESAVREDKDGRPKVSLMTVHNAKGLEFEHVFVVGLEQGVFPNSRTFGNVDEYEEERRLFYVALTRARRTLTLSRALRRMRAGFWDTTEPSNFLREIDESVLGDAERRALGIVETNLPLPGGYGASPTSYGNRAFGNQSAALGRLPGTRPMGSSGSPNAAARNTLNIGDRVEHNVLGVGTVTEKGGRPGMEKVLVEFDDGRSQEFVLRFAPLKKVG